MPPSPRLLCVVIGIPGSGKSTLVAAALKGVIAVPVKKPFAHRVLQGRGIELGARRESFSGTDALAMDAQPKVVQWLSSPQFPYRAVIAEGDRLANEKFFGAMQEADWVVDVVLLDTPPEQAAARREARGSNQNPTWIAGRITKIENICNAGWPEIALDGSQPVDLLAAQLREHSEVVRILRGEA